MDCTYCGEEVKEWKDEHDDIFTHICKKCYKKPRTQEKDSKSPNAD